MENGIGDTLWLIAVFGGPVLMALVIVYAAWQWRHRRRDLDLAREATTRANYMEEDGKSRAEHRAEPGRHHA